MPLIFITDPIPSFNKGEWAILEGIILTLKQQGRELQFTLLSRDQKQDALQYKGLCRVIAKNDWFSVLRNYLKCDALIVGHDSSINYISVLIGNILHKPVVIYAGSLGKYQNRIRKLVSKYLLSKVNLITFREKISFDLAQEMKISNIPMYIVADVAFLLEPCAEAVTKKIVETEIGTINRPLVGVTLTREMCEHSNICINEINERYHRAVKTKAKIFDFIVENFNAQIIFLPHSIGPGRLDDRKVAEDVIMEMKHHSCVKSITRDYSPSELKGLISRCWIFVGERTHSVIAALSQGVPSICLTFSSDVRTHGIIGEMMQQEQYVYNVDQLDESELISLIEQLIKSREKTANMLRLKESEIRKKALLSGELFWKHILKES